MRGKGKERGDRSRNSKISPDVDLRNWLKRDNRNRRDSLEDKERFKSDKDRNRRSRCGKLRSPPFKRQETSKGRFSPPDPSFRKRRSRSPRRSRGHEHDRRHDDDWKHEEKDSRRFRSRSKDGSDFEQFSHHSANHDKDILYPDQHEDNFRTLEQVRGDFEDADQYYLGNDGPPSTSLFRDKDIQIADHAQRNIDVRNYFYANETQNFDPSDVRGLSEVSFLEDKKLDERPNNEDEIPEFNPETAKISARSWLRILEDIAALKKWPEDEKRYNMSLKLSGFARQWYLTTGKNFSAWKELKNKFLAAFPSDMDFCTLLEDMLKRKKLKNESMISYFESKVCLLNACDITGAKAVSCIIAGLQNSSFRRAAKDKDFSNINDLLDFLKTEPEIDNADLEKSQACYKCRSKGHKKKDCPELNTCTYCHRKGHFENECVTKKEDESCSRSNNKVMFGALADIPTYPQYFKDVQLNGITVRGYLDFSSDSVTVREDTCIKMGLQYRKVYEMIRSFGGTLVSCVGELEGVLAIDDVFARVIIHVVPDHIQAVPVLVGKTFTQQPHIVISSDANNVYLRRKEDNRQLYVSQISVEAGPHYY